MIKKTDKNQERIVRHKRVRRLLELLLDHVFAFTDHFHQSMLKLLMILLELLLFLLQLLIKMLKHLSLARANLNKLKLLEKQLLNARLKRTSQKLFSIEADTSILDVFRLWLMVPEKLDSNFRRKSWLKTNKSM